MLILGFFVILIIFSNQYLLFNEELFIILAFFSLCFFVKTNLGGVVENELKDRKTKILNSYLDFLRKKSRNVNTSAKSLNEVANYLCNLDEIQSNFLAKFNDNIDFIKNQLNIDSLKSLELKFVIYFAGLVSNKRKFI